MRAIQGDFYTRHKGLLAVLHLEVKSAWGRVLKVCACIQTLLIMLLLLKSIVCISTVCKALVSVVGMLRPDPGSIEFDLNLLCRYKLVKDVLFCQYLGLLLELLP